MIRCRNCGERPASEGHICMVCKRRSDIDPYKALIAMALLVYCGVSLAACCTVLRLTPCSMLMARTEGSRSPGR